MALIIKKQMWNRSYRWCNATMKCNANIKEIDLASKKIWIKEQELEGQYNNIYLDGLNDVEFIGAKSSGGGVADIDQQLEKYEGLITGLVIGSVAIIAIVSLSVYFYRKKKYMEKIEENKPEDVKI